MYLDLSLIIHRGWRSWEAYYGGVDESKMRATIDVLADRSRYVDEATGAPCKPPSIGCKKMSLADFGFSDAGLDSGFEDCGARKVGGKPAFHDETGRPLVDGKKFPAGLANLVDYGHSKNLTVSWYVFSSTCFSMILIKKSHNLLQVR